MGSFNKKRLEAIKGKGIYITTKDDRKILDGCSGAGVSCIGHGNKRVTNAITKQNKTGITYLSSSWDNQVVHELCTNLKKGTGNVMVKVYLLNSGSEAIEAAIKLAFSYHCENNEMKRINIIARKGSYHGATLTALALSGYYARKKFYLDILRHNNNIYYVSPCYSYREQIEWESNADFVKRKALELEQKIIEIGPDTVMAFILEPIVGAALGCATFVPGYLEAVKKVCVKYGVVLIFDEIMCGMGRSGTLHTWQSENVKPDIQIVAKGLGGGYVPISAVLASESIIKVIKKGSGQFVHGQTYEGMPSIAAGALEVQKIIQDNNLLDNVSKQGIYLETRLKAVLGNHPNVGDIRGRGLFWGIEFVKEKASKEPFDSNIAYDIRDSFLSPPFNMTVYAGVGFVDGKRGDHIILAPPFTVKKKEVELIVTTVLAAVNCFFLNPPS